MSDIVVFNEGTDEFVRHIQSTNADLFTGRTDVVVFLDSNVSAVHGIRALLDSVPLRKFLRHDSGTIREMTVAEQKVITDAEQVIEDDRTTLVDGTKTKLRGLGLTDAEIALILVGI